MSYILVIDSGLGGLTVSRAISSKIPAVNQIYVADTAGFPYGSRSEDFVIERVESITKSVMNRFDIKLIVVACNTASTIVLPQLREQIKLPVVGVVPAIKPAAGQTKLPTFGILATPQTIVRAYTDQLIADHAAAKKVIRVGSQRLVEIAEASLCGGEVDHDELRKICSPFFDGSKRLVDTVVLGCTHFPLLKEDLQKAVSRKIKWIDSGQAIAQRVFNLLVDGRIDPGLAQRYTVFFSTKNIDQKLKSKLSEEAWTRFETLSLADSAHY